MYSWCPSCQPKRISSSTAAVDKLRPAFFPELIDALRRCGPGDLLAVIGSEEALGADLEAWCRFTRNTLVDKTVELARTRWVIRFGEAPANADAARPIRFPPFGSTRISTATCIATTVACAPHPKFQDGSLVWRGFGRIRPASGPPRRRRNLRDRW